MLAIQDLKDSWSWVFLIHFSWLPRPLGLWTNTTNEITKNSPSFSSEWSGEPLLQQGSWGKLSCQSLQKESNDSTIVVSSCGNVRPRKAMILCLQMCFTQNQDTICWNQLLRVHLESPFSAWPTPWTGHAVPSVPHWLGPRCSEIIVQSLPSFWNAQNEVR